MDVETALRRIKRQFGDEYDVLILDDDIYGWIYEAEMDIIRNTGSNELQMVQSSSVFPLDIPTNINIVRLSIDGKVLHPLTPTEMGNQGFNLDATGYRSSWYKKGTKVYLYPNDSIVQNVTIDYVKTPLMLAGPPETCVFTLPERYHTDIVQYCLARAHNKNRNHQAEKFAMDNYDRSLGIRREENQSIDGPVYKGSDPMDYEAEMEYW